MNYLIPVIGLVHWGFKLPAEKSFAPISAAIFRKCGQRLLLHKHYRPQGCSPAPGTVPPGLKAIAALRLFAEIFPSAYCLFGFPFRLFCFDLYFLLGCQGWFFPFGNPGLFFFVRQHFPGNTFGRHGPERRTV